MNPIYLKFYTPSDNSCVYASNSRQVDYEGNTSPESVVLTDPHTRDMYYNTITTINSYVPISGASCSIIGHDDLSAGISCFVPGSGIYQLDLSRSIVDQGIDSVQFKTFAPVCTELHHLNCSNGMVPDEFIRKVRALDVVRECDCKLNTRPALSTSRYPSLDLINVKTSKSPGFFRRVVGNLEIKQLNCSVLDLAAIDFMYIARVESLLMGDIDPLLVVNRKIPVSNIRLNRLMSGALFELLFNVGRIESLNLNCELTGPCSVINDKGVVVSFRKTTEVLKSVHKCIRLVSSSIERLFLHDTFSLFSFKDLYLPALQKLRVPEACLSSVNTRRMPSLSSLICDSIRGLDMATSFSLDELAVAGDLSCMMKKYRKVKIVRLVRDVGPNQYLIPLPTVLPDQLVVHLAASLGSVRQILVLTLRFGRPT